MTTENTHHAGATQVISNPHANIILFHGVRHPGGFRKDAAAFRASPRGGVS